MRLLRSGVLVIVIGGNKAGSVRAEGGVVMAYRKKSFHKKGKRKSFKKGRSHKKSGRTYGATVNARMASRNGTRF